MQIPPLSTTDVCLAFKRMVEKIKISKLQDCNYKILHRILANPAQILHNRKQPQLAFCVWCGLKAMLDHIMTKCMATRQICDDLVIKLGDLSDAEWIIGHKDLDILYLISVYNFAIYKAHIMITSGYNGSLQSIIEYTLQCFSPVVRVIRTFDLI